MPKFLAVYVGDPASGPPSEMSQDTIARGMQAWGDWMQQHAAAVVETGGPLGRTKKVSKSGVEDIRNRMGGYVVIEADSHEAAAKMFETHPHFTIFPGDGVEVMPVLDIPKMPD
jgi:hypothetical protein